MQDATIAEWCRLVHAEVLRGLDEMPGVTLGAFTVQLRLECTPGTGDARGEVRVIPDHPGEPTTQDGSGARVSLEFKVGHAAPTGGKDLPAVFSGKAAAAPRSVDQPPAGSDRSLRRKLELVLGGPPGFTTGARAEMLSDLLQEFGIPPVLEAISRDWISQFDTGIQSSPSVS